MLLTLLNKLRRAKIEIKINYLLSMLLIHVIYRQYHRQYLSEQGRTLKSPEIMLRYSTIFAVALQRKLYNPFWNMKSNIPYPEMNFIMLY